MRAGRPAAQGDIRFTAFPCQAKPRLAFTEPQLKFIICLVLFLSIFFFIFI